MNFLWSTLNVTDIQKSIDFYSDILGLEIVRRFETGHGTIAFLGKDETKIELISDGSNREISVGPDISWGFSVESLDDTIKMLDEKGIKIVAGPIQPSPSIRFIFINDPDGMKIQLVENKD